MFDVQSFLNSVQQADDRATLTLMPNRRDLAVRSGRVAQWFARFRTVENNLIAGRFVNALSQQYGLELTARVVRDTGFAETLARSRPLRARKVREVAARLHDLQGNVKERNERRADEFVAGRISAAGRSAGMPLLRSKIEIVVASSPRYSSLCGVANIVDCDAVVRKFQDRVVAQSRDGKHLVTSREFEHLLTRTIEDELASTYAGARGRALERLSLCPGSITHDALVAARAALRPPLNIGPDDLTRDAGQALCGRIKAVVDGDFPADALDDPEALRALASHEVAGFVAERIAARAEVEALQIPGDFGGRKKAALLAQVSCDNIPARLAQTLGLAYNEVEKDLARLAKPLPREHFLAPQQLQNSISAIHLAISRAFAAADVKPLVSDQSELHRFAWRFLLAPGGVSGAEAIHGQLAPSDSLLRELGEAATWYGYWFPGPGEWERKYESADRSLHGKRIHTEETRHTAACYAELINSLASVLEEQLGNRVDAVPLGWNDAPADRAIATLRNLGIPFPAPNRLGADKANDDVLLCESQMKEMSTKLGLHLNQSRREKTDVFGIAMGCREYLDEDHERYTELHRRLGSGRAFVRYYIDSEQFLPQDPDAVAQALRNFCLETDGRGNQAANSKMLKKISAMAHHATLDCLYSGCLNPDRPDLAIMDGRIVSATKHTAFRLSRNENNEVRLEIEEELRPFWYLPVNKDNANRRMGRATDDDASADRIPLSPTQSHVHTRVAMKFDSRRYNPEIDRVDVDYCLVEGIHDDREYPYIIRNPSA